jgi:pyruvate/2-oxoglutarate/acetoin dehydrogenase E1 component
VTIVTFGALVHRSLLAARPRRADGIDVEVLDLRSLAPTTGRPIAESVKKTGA